MNNARVNGLEVHREADKEQLRALWVELRRLRNELAALSQAQGAPISQPPSSGPTLDFAVMRTTSVFPKMVGTTPGSGTAVIQVLSGSSYVDGPTTVTVYWNVSDKTLLSNAIIESVLKGSTWYCIGVDSCNSLGS